MTRIIFYLITALLLATTFSACAILPRESKVPPEPANVQKATKQPDTTALKNARAQKRARRLLEKQEYADTVNLIRDEVGKGAEEQALAEEYLEAVNNCLEHADERMKTADYPGAARLYKTVLDGYPKAPELQQRVALTHEQIIDRLDLCAENLMEAGLFAYRAGEFTKGIDIWQQILAFDPQHQAALDAIETTQEQLTRLKTLNEVE